MSTSVLLVCLSLSTYSPYLYACTNVSRYGEIVNINLVREKKTGKPKGFCFLCYDDQRSTILAVDNLNGIKVSKPLNLSLYTWMIVTICLCNTCNWANATLQAIQAV